MIQLSQACLNLVLLNTSLKIADSETFALLEAQSSDISEGSGVYLGLGSTDFLVVLPSPVRRHPIVQLPNIRSTGLIRVRGIQGRVGSPPWTGKDAIGLLCCAKLNPRVKGKLGIAALSGEFLPQFDALRQELSKRGVTANAFVTVGWPDIVLLLAGNGVTPLLESALAIRNLSTVSAGEKERLFSTTFSQLFFASDRDLHLKLLENEGADRFQFYTRVYCKPGGHTSVEDALLAYGSNCLLGKADIGVVIPSMRASEFMGFMLSLRASHRDKVYSTESEIMFKAVVPC